MTAERSPITASTMRDMTLCEHRVAMDLFADRSGRDPVGAFAAMLWEEGSEHEAAILEGLAPDALDLRGRPAVEREAATTAALAGRRGTILGARIRSDDLLGDPDLLIADDGGWIAGDVKSGSAIRDGRPRRTYSVQVAHYAAILERVGAGDAARAFVLDRRGATVPYALDAPAGPRSPTPNQTHATLLARARAIRNGAPTRPALAAECKGCHWKSACRRRLVADDDPTLVAELGRAARDALAPLAPTVAVLADLDVAVVGPDGPPKGVGADRLARFVERARLLREPRPGAYARAPLPLARADHELFLDIEADPLAGELVYLHGVLERIAGPGGGTERYHAFFAEDGPRGERDAFADVVAFLRSAPAAKVYVYSAYERTAYRRLRARYPEVCPAEEIEALFDPRRTVDLLTAVVRPLTEWPAWDRSIKSLARLCGFEWRDQDPSGANSIEWYRSWTRTRDSALRERIVRYNEDDNVACRVLLDALLELPVRPVVGVGRPA